ncbi:MAG: flagellar type III secretion system pore protein FliP [Gemmatimonadales bacterium]
MMLTAMASLLITLGALGGGLWLLRRFVPGARSGAVSIPLNVLRRVATGPKHGVALLQVGERVLLVSLAEDGARLLTEIEGEDRKAALTPVGVSAPSGATSAIFRLPSRRSGILRWLPVALALLAIPSVMPAQAARRAPAAVAAGAVQGPTAPRVTVTIGQGSDQLQLSGAVGIVVFMGAMTLLPAMFLLMTSFTRILIVLHFVRTAIGTQTAPPGQLLVALAVLMTGIVMRPVMEQANTEALQPYLAGQMPQAEAYQKALVPMRHFMLVNTREKDLGVFAELTGQEEADSLEALPTLTITGAFVTSELRTAFQMGFVIFLPFVVVDLIVASVLMSMGMFMLPPVMISLPFKLMLFVLADGWTLVVQRLITSFQT